MSWPYYYTNGSGYSTSAPPQSERQQGLALVGLNAQGGMSDTLDKALQGFSDTHMASHYFPTGHPRSHSVNRSPWLTSQPCHPHPGLCTCGLCPEGISYTGGVALGGGLPLKLPNPEYEFLSALAHRPLPVLDTSTPEGLGPERAVKWKDIPRARPNWAQIGAKPPSWTDMDVEGKKYVRHAADCPRLRNRTFWCSCGAESNVALRGHIVATAHGPCRGQGAHPCGVCAAQCPPPKKGVWGKLKAIFE